MMVDEHWKYNVADGNGEFPRNGGAWMRSDAVWWGAVSEIGRYHGQPVNGLAAPFPGEDDPEVPTGVTTAAVKRGNVGFYDGHASLERDFMPGHDAIGAILRPDARGAIIDWVVSHRFFQRGKAEDVTGFLPS
ncbi:MAG: hypothetical protein JXQ73_05750 [Phycisphaerae bacterium]|nr:hypothetical protein [Phycisphaerae bacterium]